MSDSSIKRKLLWVLFGIGWALAVCLVEGSVQFEPFHVGVFEGIKPGTSTAADVLRRWGRPEAKFKNGEGFEVLYFKDPRQSGWDVEVWCTGRQMKVVSIFVLFNQRKSKEEVERVFGLRLQWKSYKKDLCAATGGQVPFYEVQGRGERELYEDRVRGAVCHPEGIDIRIIEFPDRPVGSPRSRCTAKTGGG